jgi:serine/threonine protein kinase
MPFAIGDTVGPYRIVEQIGQGGMATVFKAYHANLDRYVALKVLHPAFKEDPNFLERFKREAQIVARLEHPSIVPVYDFDDVGGQPFLVMKFIEGETLKARLRRQPLTLVETIRILEVVANGLTYAHEQGILHRDIKPSNIMLDRQGAPYIADFGLARIAQAGESTLSQDMMLGTPQYISPEQAQGMRDLGPSTDIYSLGVVLYEIVAGRVPFNADTPYAIVHDHIYKSLPLPSHVNPGVPLPVERVLLKTLAKNPPDRYATAVDMVAAFRQAVEEAGITELSAAQYRSSVAPVSSSAVTAPDYISPTPPYPAVPAPMMQPTGSSSARRIAQRRRKNLWILGGVGALLVICLASLFIIVSAVSDPDLRPWNSDAVDNEVPTDRPTLFDLPDVSVAEAERLVEENPDDPVDRLVLAMAQFQDGSTLAAFRSVFYASNRLNAGGDLMAAAARRANQANNPGLAVVLYLEVLATDQLSPELRNEAGEYLFNHVQQYPEPTALLLSEIEPARTRTAYMYTLFALAKLQDSRVYNTEQAWNSLEAAFALDETLPEAYLVRGLYYAATDQPENARSDWEAAIKLPGCPAWVSAEALDQLERLPDA